MGSMNVCGWMVRTLLEIRAIIGFMQLVSTHHPHQTIHTEKEVLRDHARSLWQMHRIPLKLDKAARG